jgi:hypothetical protein
MAKEHGAVNDRPHSFVLADLFDVEAMTLEVPDHILESDPLERGVTCPTCEGEKWLDTGHNHWTKALFTDARMAYAHRQVNSSYKVCGRCSGVGEVLDDLTAQKNQKRLSFHSKNSENLVTKTVAKNPRSTPRK